MSESTNVQGLEVTRYQKAVPGPFLLRLRCRRGTRSALSVKSRLISEKSANTGAICAAAECLANHSKCPLPLWMDTLARPEQNSAGEDSAAAGRAQGLVPWGTTGEAAAARVRELSPVLLTRSKKQGTEHKVDVHEAVQGLIDAATNIDAMCAMPSAFQAWI